MEKESLKDLIRLVRYHKVSVNSATNTLYELMKKDIEYCDHYHTSSCQNDKDCPCFNDHECNKGIILQD